MEPIRRVVTGHDEQGRAVVAEDGPVAPITLSLLPGFETTELWHTDTTPSLPGGLGGPGAPRYFPPTGGTVCRVVTFPPDGAAADPDLDVGAALAEAQERVPDLMARLEPDHPGMHTTDTVDYGIVLDGEIELELDDGAVTAVGPGTVVVQRATRHRWRNRSGRPVRVAFILIGAEPAG